MVMNILKLKDIDLQRELIGQFEVVNRVYEHYRSVAEPELLVLSHNDVYNANFLFCSRTSRLKLIDFEFSGYNPLGMDVLLLYVNMLFVYKSSDSKEVVADFSILPTEEQFRRIIRLYLFFYKHGKDYEDFPQDEAFTALIESDPLYADIPDDEVEAVIARFGYMGALIQIFFIYWALIRCGDENCEFDYTSYVKPRYDILSHFLTLDGLDIREFENQAGI